MHLDLLSIPQSGGKNVKTFVITIKYTYNSLIDMGGPRLQRAIETDIQ